ncbi:MAG: hypothetical protein KDE04_25465, partial [Anaerolineales bacterium]|nr:hypothetical protein [Anaerolineales bacterium]
MQLDREFRTWQEQLRSNLHGWESSQEDKGALLRGAPLLEAEQWLLHQQEDLTAREQAYIRKSQERQRQSMRLRNIVVIGLAVVAVVLGILAFALNNSTRQVSAQATQVVEAFATSGTAVAAALATSEANAQSLALAEEFANGETTRAVESEQIARSAQAEAEISALVSQAQLLAVQGDNLYEESPLAGLRLLIEGWLRVPQERHDIRDLLLDRLFRLSQSGRIRNISATAERWWWSPDHSTVVITSATQGEIRRSSDGAILAELPGMVTLVGFGRNPEAPIWVIDYQDIPAEIRQAGDGALIAALPDNISAIYSGPDSDSPLFVIEYREAPGEIR